MINLMILFFSITLQIHENNNRADISNIFKNYIKTADFKNISKAFLDDRIYTLITYGKIINKITLNADSYYSNEKETHTPSLKLENTSPIV